MTLNGIRIVESPACFKRETAFKRVKGGYLNRWLIRVEVVTITPMALHDPARNMTYMHPDLYARLLDKTRKDTWNSLTTNARTLS